jgi:S-adenosylmethionine hydrolase
VLPISHPDEHGLVAEVLWVDHFGNAQLNVDPDAIEAFGERVALRAGEQRRTAPRGWRWRA